MTNSKFHNAFTYTSSFKNCILDKARFYKTSLKTSFLENASLDSTYVDCQFMNELMSKDENDSIYGRHQILDNFRIDSTGGFSTYNNERICKFKLILKNQN
jgi:uncharacterized protein YjbI with pentapeptide repeats